MLKDIAAVIMVPSRRVPAPLYAGLQILAAATAAVAYLGVCREVEHASSGMQAIVLVLIWANFCIMANRFHDAGVSCLWLFPLFLLGTVIYLVDLDPVMLGKDWATHELWSGRLGFAKQVFSLMACATAAIAMIAQPSDGRNRFGMPLGEKDWTRADEHFIAGLASAPGFAKSHRKSIVTPPHVDTATQMRAVREGLRRGPAGRTFSQRG